MIDLNTIKLSLKTALIYSIMEKQSKSLIMKIYKLNKKVFQTLLNLKLHRILINKLLSSIWEVNKTKLYGELLIKEMRIP